VTFAAWTHADVALALSLPPWVLFWFLWACVRCLAADLQRDVRWRQRMANEFGGVWGPE
jgi:hypothetical protein